MDVHHISDLSHPLLADYKGLTDVALRSVSEPAEGLYIAESLKILERALRAGHRARSVLTIPQWLEKLEEHGRDAPDFLADVPVFVASSELIEQLAGFLVHRGTLASMVRPELPTVDELLADARLVVVLEGIVDHTNVGAVFRSVAGMGADAVIVSETCADPLYRRSVRVSMGTVFQVPWTRATSWSSLSGSLKDHGFVTAALALDPEAVSLDVFARDAPEKIALLLGTEGDGLSAQALNSADTSVSIPMHGGVDSLNVAAASAVAMWALRR